MPTSRSAPPLAAYVLHSWDWSESSLILDLFTRSQGRVVAAAKGAKRPTSNYRAVLLPFHPLSIWLSRAAAEQPGDEQGELRTLRAVEWGGGAPLPAAALMSGFYLNELLQKGLARQDPHPTLFDAYADTLGALAAAAPLPEHEAAALRAFELVLLRELGWLPALDALTHSAEPLAAKLRYGLRAEVGVMPDAEGATGATWVSLQAALQHGSLDALRQVCLTEHAALRGPLRNLVHYHLATPALRTRRIGQQMQRLSGHAARTRPAPVAPGNSDKPQTPAS